jgi:hypothetical protein
MKATIFLSITIGLVGCVTAQASTLRVTCDDSATGAEVSVDHKFKGECPIDIQINQGQHSLNAVKKIAGKDVKFEQDIKIGEGVFKDVKVLFDRPPTVAPSPSKPVESSDAAKQRYQKEADDYNRSLQGVY